MLRYKTIVPLLLLFGLSFTARAQQSDSAATEEAAPDKKGAKISLQHNENDSMHLVTAAVVDSAAGTPLANVELTLYIKRTFGLMKVGNATTDSSGAASAEFKKDIRSDQQGTVLLVAKIEDNDAINNTQVQAALNPDLPYRKSQPIGRAMFARHAPWWLVITFTGLMATVWIVFAYVLYLVKKIRNAGLIHLSTKTIQS